MYILNLDGIPDDWQTSRDPFPHICHIDTQSAIRYIREYPQSIKRIRDYTFHTCSLGFVRYIIEAKYLSGMPPIEILEKFIYNLVDDRSIQIFEYLNSIYNYSSKDLKRFEPEDTDD